MLLVTSSCLFDPDEKPIDDDDDDSGAVQKMDLTEPWHVLNNIEYAYKVRDRNTYDELLDEQFTFFFSQGDVDEGLPVQWGRPDELGATNDLFISNSQPVPVGPECRSIRLDLLLTNIQWVEIIPDGYPDETWFSTTIFYTFTFEMAPDQTYVAETGAKAVFTVRNVGTEAAPLWKLVEFRDLGKGV